LERSAEGCADGITEGQQLNRSAEHTRQAAHARFFERFKHFLRFAELLEKPVDILDISPGAASDPPPAAGV
jgi:hypothetical protein